MENQSYRKITGLTDNIRITDRPLAVNSAGVFNTSNLVLRDCTRIDFYFMYIWDGFLNLTYKGKKSRLAPGRFIVYAPDEKVKYTSVEKNNLVYMWLHFTGYNAQRLLADSGVPVGEVREIGVHNAFVEHFQRLFREFMILDKNFDSASTSILTEIMVLLGRQLKNKRQAARPLHSIEYIHKNYSSGIDVDALAAMEHLSVSHYRTLFKASTGLSPGDYIITHRIQVACRLLCDSFRPVSNVAQMVGYDDSLYFSRIFKKKIGVSPSQYRSRILI